MEFFVTPGISHVVRISFDEAKILREFLFKAMKHADKDILHTFRFKPSKRGRHGLIIQLVEDEKKYRTRVLSEHIRVRKYDIDPVSSRLFYQPMLMCR